MIGKNDAGAGGRLVVGTEVRGGNCQLMRDGADQRQADEWSVTDDGDNQELGRSAGRRAPRD